MSFHHLSPDALCPCESGRTIRLCCRQADGRVHPNAQVTAPPGAPTGFAHPQCYAGGLRDCSARLSREHFISEGVLEQISDAGEGGLDATGFHWLNDGEAMPLSPKSMSAKVLCQRHNEALSPLDTVASRFFRTLERVEPRRLATLDQRLFIFNGHDLERWMLKILCGCGAAPILRMPGGPPRQFRPDLEVLQHLFGPKVMENGSGLYVGDSGDVRDRRGIVWQVYGAGTPWGIQVWLFGYLLVLHLGPRELMPWPRAVYRPRSIRPEFDGATATIGIVWDKEGDGVSVHAKFTRTSPS